MIPAFVRATRVAAAGLALAASAAGPGARAAGQPAAKPALRVPVDYSKLKNGLRVVISPDASVPTVVVAVYYGVGFRTETRSRTGFAHLFEHMMFQGSANLGKTQFIKLVEGVGGILNGSTRFDYTNYFQVVPSNAFETVMWAEADRMRGLSITQENLVNQQGVVKNEVKVNVLNTPYGGFPWLDMPQLANLKWQNAHNFYGDLSDLDAATLEDVRQFFTTYYAPNNAVLVVTGDVTMARGRALARKYFGAIPSQPQPAAPDIAEPRQEAERRSSKEDPQAPRPALAIAWHVPPRWTPEWFAFGLLDQVLAQGRDSRLYDAVVRQRALTGSVGAGINQGLGNQFNYAGPMLYIVSAFHDARTNPDTLISAIEREVARLRTEPVDQATLDRALTKWRSSFYSYLEGLSGFGRADLLASLALFDDNPARVNEIEAGFAKVTPELIRKTAEEWLRPGNRTILTVVPAPPKPATGGN
ncbi:MAG: insulinase family protein [Gemmatimonadetes bacterium]|nr:insulinase family protein [Gemmatimonadota bacterium]